MAKRIGGKQSGMTMWSLLFVGAVVVFFVLLFFKLAPPYMDNYKVVTAVKNVAGQPNAASMSREDIANALGRHFEIDDVDNVDLKKALRVERSNPNGPAVIHVTYQVRVPVAYNITALIDFDDSAPVGAK